MIEFFIAKRHILERKKQSIAAMLGTAIGITVLIVSIGISNGLNKNMIDSILSISSHIVVQDKTEIADYKEKASQIEELKGVRGVVPKMSIEGILKYDGPFNNYRTGVRVDGLDLQKAIDGMGLDKKIVEGKIEPNNYKNILIGKALYDQLGASLGDKLTIVSESEKSVSFTIGGVFQSGYYEYDTKLLILPLRSVQALSYSGDVVESIDVMLDNPYKAPDIANEISYKTNLFTRTWGDLNKNLLKALSLERTVMILVFSLIVVIAGFVVWVTLNTLVREKIKDIGIMRSMGFSSKQVMRTFLIEGMTLGGAGILIGVVISLTILWYVKTYSIASLTKIYYLTKIPVEITPSEIFIIIGANIIIILISSIFPAYRAAKLQPVEALKYE